MIIQHQITSHINCIVPSVKGCDSNTFYYNTILDALPPAIKSRRVCTRGGGVQGGAAPPQKKNKQKQNKKQKTKTKTKTKKANLKKIGRKEGKK